jgi:hypothetical protein
MGVVGGSPHWGGYVERPPHAAKRVLCQLLAAAAAFGFCDRCSSPPASKGACPGQKQQTGAADKEHTRMLLSACTVDI